MTSRCNSEHDGTNGEPYYIRGHSELKRQKAPEKLHGAQQRSDAFLRLKVKLSREAMHHVSLEQNCVQRYRLSLQPRSSCPKASVDNEKRPSFDTFRSLLLFRPTKAILNVQRCGLSDVAEQVGRHPRARQHAESRHARHHRTV